MPFVALCCPKVPHIGLCALRYPNGSLYSPKNETRVWLGGRVLVVQ